MVMPVLAAVVMIVMIMAMVVGMIMMIVMSTDRTLDLSDRPVAQAFDLHGRRRMSRIRRHRRLVDQP